MPLKTPAFWYRNASRPASLPEVALTPLSWIYEAGRKFKTAKTIMESVEPPVLCVGNIVTGGSGKTPVVAAIRKLLRSQNLAKDPFILSRGYGGTLPGPLLVDPARQKFTEVGDEPVLLARDGPVIVSRNRLEGARMAERSGADMILMDDGFQNPSLKKDLSLLVIDGPSGLGNEKLLPAGPLRETLREALERTQAIIIIGSDERGVEQKIPPHIPIFSASVKPRQIPDQQKKYIAFAGLGRPEKFQKTLEECGLKLVAFHPFPDHHPFSGADIEKLLQEAKNKNAVLITTEKDWIRLPEDGRNQIQTLPIALEWSDPEAVTVFLQKTLEKLKREKTVAP